MRLLKKKRGERLLISGVHPSIRRAELRRAIQADPTLFKCCVDLDHTARDTISNATESAKWIRANGYHRVILVTNNYHMPRSLVEMRRAAAGVDFVPFPVVTSELGDNRWMFRTRALRVLFIEYVKYLASVARGVLPAPMSAAPPRHGNGPESLGLERRPGSRPAALRVCATVRERTADRRNGT